tara:strand:+ start:460 stop:1362 length:903 start_codon:yes stop_codon:yes gene_type:complete
MNVPNLWLTAGVQYAATSPLAYTLQIANKYCHGGHRKENKYLYTLDKVQPIQRRWTYYKRTQKLANKQSYIGENDWHTSDISFIGKVASYVNLKDVWTAPNTIGKYMQYYYDVWNIVKDEYQSVANYDNVIGELSYEFFDKYHYTLSSHFNIKVGIIVRDPVRRSWSEETLWDNKFRYYDEPRDWSFSNKYFEIYDKLSKYFTTQFIVMEELWEGDGKEKEKLSNYINYPIKDLYRNAFSPDRGHLQEKISGLMDQCQKQPELTEKEYYKGKKVFSEVYDEWIRRFGKLPLNWGKPLNYE